MKTPTLLLSSLLLASALFVSPLARAEQEGHGGDASEIRVDEIRLDILKWINDGGAQQLELPSTISYDNYRDGMERVLAPGAVTVTFVTTEEESSPGYKGKRLSVQGKSKTCVNYAPESAASQGSFVCNIERFAATPEAEQYSLIHHEYATLAGIETSSGAMSDYTVSSKVTGFLERKAVLRLAIKRPVIPTLEVPGEERCPEPLPAAADLFAMLEGSRTQAQKISDIQKYLYANAVSLTALNSRCETLLLASIRLRQQEIFQSLYKNQYKRPNVNAVVVGSAASPYVYALEYGNMDLITSLKKLGGSAQRAEDSLFKWPYFWITYRNTHVNPETATELMARTDLMFAARKNSPTVIQELILAGDQVDAVVRGYTAIVGAATHNLDPQATLALIDAGAQPETMYENRTLVDATVSINPNPEVVLALIHAGADLNRGFAAVFAVNNPNLDVLRAVIRAGALINKGGLFDNPLSTHNPEAQRILLEAGAKPDPQAEELYKEFKDYKHNNVAALQTILRSSAPDAITQAQRYLQEHLVALDGYTLANPDQPTSTWWPYAALENPLMMAVRYQGVQGLTALSSSYLTSIRPVIALADNKDSQSLYNYTLMYGNWDSILEMRELGGKIQYGTYDIGYGAENPDAEVMRNLVAERENLDLHGAALAIAAAKNPNAQVIQLLIDAKFDVNAPHRINPDQQGAYTPLYYARHFNSNPAVAAALVRAGAKED